MCIRPRPATIAGNCRPQGLRTRHRLAGLEEGNGRGVPRPHRIHLIRKRALVPSAWTRGSLGWTYEREDRPHTTIGYEAQPHGRGERMASASLPNGTSRPTKAKSMHVRSQVDLRRKADPLWS